MAVSEDEFVSGAIRHTPLSIVLTDPNLEDNPITYVNDAFQKLTLYSREYAVGRNCRFLQGPDTDPRDIERIREGLQAEKEFHATIRNHRADGTSFLNQLFVAPVYDTNGGLTAFLGVYRALNGEAAAGSAEQDNGLALLQELQHRVKNHLAMIVSMIRIQARREVTPDSLKAVSRRIEALALLYDELINTGRGNGSSEISAGAYMSRIASVVSSLEGRAAIRVIVDCGDVRLPVDQAARIGLLLSEFLTNALAHAFTGRDAGSVEVRFRQTDDGGTRLVVEDDGVGMPSGSHWPSGAASIESQRDRASHEGGALDTTGHGRQPGVGGSIVVALTESLGAGLDVKSSRRGTIVTLAVGPPA